MPPVHRPRGEAAGCADEARQRHEDHGDRHGLPLAVTSHAEIHHEVTLVQLTFDLDMIEAKPDYLSGDRAYDSAPLCAPLRE